jgi:hypothetical protein
MDKDTAFSNLINRFKSIIGKCFIYNDGTDYIQYIQFTGINEFDLYTEICAITYSIDKSNEGFFGKGCFTLPKKYCDIDGYNEELDSYIEITKDEFNSKIKNAMLNWLNINNIN